VQLLGQQALHQLDALGGVVGLRRVGPKWEAGGRACAGAAPDTPPASSDVQSRPALVRCSESDAACRRHTHDGTPPSKHTYTPRRTPPALA
jgi:hypothetical protein